MGMLFKLIGMNPLLLFLLLNSNQKNISVWQQDYKCLTILNYIAMNRKATIRHSARYHEEGIGTVTILMAILTVSIIFYSIYSSM
jgi:hypothetical protein